MGERVRITEVGPRDGLQNEPGVIPTAEKARLVELCAHSGVDEVEVTSFVSPKWVPQLGDAAELCALLDPTLGRGVRRSTLELSALVPNLTGLESFQAANAAGQGGLLDKVSVFTAASEMFSRKNTNASIVESIARHAEVRGRMLDLRPVPRLRAYISCVIACPFEGPIAPERVAEVVDRVWTVLRPDEIDLGDTVGAGLPETVAAMLRAVMARSSGWSAPGAAGDTHQAASLVLHLHDTFGHATECVRAALDLGVRSFDSSVAGLGGCPYASVPGRRAPGNIATESLVQTVHDAGYATGVDPEALATAAAYARQIVARARASVSAERGGEA